MEFAPIAKGVDFHGFEVSIWRGSLNGDSGCIIKKKFAFVLFQENPDFEKHVAEMKWANMLVQKETQKKKTRKKKLLVILNILFSLESVIIFVSFLIKVIADTIIMKLY